MKKNNLLYCHKRSKLYQHNVKYILQSNGQVVLEYLLLMVVAVSIAALLTQALVKRSTDESGQGMIIKSWNKMLGVIGNDLPDCPRQSNYANPPSCR